MGSAVVQPPGSTTAKRPLSLYCYGTATLPLVELLRERWWLLSNQLGCEPFSSCGLKRERESLMTQLVGARVATSC